MFVRLASAARDAGAARVVGIAGAARGAASAPVAPPKESPTTRRIGAAVLSGAVLYTGYLSAWLFYLILMDYLGIFKVFDLMWFRRFQVINFFF